jgi:short-subunit dehydrogenase
VITGAASGFGREFARRLAQRGAPLVLLDRDAQGLDATRASLPAATRVHCATLDLCDDDATARVIATAHDAIGPIAHCVNSAGVLSFGRIEATPVRDFRRMMEVNYLGSVKTAHAVLPHLRVAATSGRAVMLFIASIAGRRATPEVGAYSASKSAVIGLAQCLRDELHGTGVDVRVLCPPPGDTPMVRDQPRLPPVYKLAPLLTAETIVGRCLDALDGDRFEVFVDMRSRALLALDWLAPSLSAWVIARVAG